MEILQAAEAGEQVGVRWDPGKMHGERGRFEVVGTKQPAWHMPARDQPATQAGQGAV